MRMLRLLALALCAACAAPESDPWQLFMPGFEVGGEPPYSDDEAAVFAMRLQVLYDRRDSHPRRTRMTAQQVIDRLGISLARLRRSNYLSGGATDWVEYRMSPTWTLTATYLQVSGFDSATLAIVRG